MAEFPAIPLWTDAYLADTTHLTTIQHGAYLLLLMCAWRLPTCDLPDDDKLLARYTRLTNSQWKRIKPDLLPFFKVENGRLIQKKLQSELAFVRQKSKRLSDAGRKGGVSKSLKNNKTPPSDATEMLEQKSGDAVAPTPTPTPTTIKKEVYTKNKNGSKLSDDWILGEGDREYAKEKGWSEGKISTQVENFIEHFTNGKGRNQASPNWSLRWKTWVRNDYGKSAAKAWNGGVDAWEVQERLHRSLK